MEEYSYDNGAASGILGAIGFVYFAIILLIIISMWKIFIKAGKPGWAAIIPIYNIIVLLEIVGKPVWWIILMLIPFVNFFVMIYVAHLLAKSFGKDIVMTILLIILPIVGYPMLAFGDAKYVGPPKD
ncbi:MAG: signal peptidase I [Cyclobacteriaceae bacterium]|nr:signal peptidase I [Cyclobacteriaceae bacterium]